MIVFFGRRDDTPLAGAVEAAARRNAEHLVVDQARLDDDDMILEVGPDGLDGRLRACGMELPLGDIRAVYARPLLTAPSGDAIADVRAGRLTEAFLEWLDEAPCLVVNRPGAMDSNGSKPYQLQLIARAGFVVPDTVVTNDPDVVRDYCARHGRVIYKSISGVRSIVQELDDPAVVRLDRVRALPTQFQAYVEGVDVRVHVVGDRVFSTEIASGAIDYRYARRDGAAATLTETELPSKVTQRCLDLAATLGLPFCGIDLRRRPDGEFVCLEVNPMPGYSWFEAEAGQPISDTLVDLLVTAEVA